MKEIRYIRLSAACALIVGIVCACNEEAPSFGCGLSRSSPTAFQCYKRGQAFRECAPKLTSCAEWGCFKQDKAYCFMAREVLSEPPNDTQLICAPTEAECAAWNEDRKTVANESLGPCFEATADQYPMSN